MPHLSASRASLVSLSLEWPLDRTTNVAAPSPAPPCLDQLNARCPLRSRWHDHIRPRRRAASAMPPEKTQKNHDKSDSLVRANISGRNVLQLSTGRDVEDFGFGGTFRFATRLRSPPNRE